jgi:hypothetical protein
MTSGVLPHDASQHPVAGAPHPVTSAEVWRLVAPGLGYVFLVVAAVLGLFTASDAPDTATYDAGLGLFVLALVLVMLRLKRQFDGRRVGLLLPLLVENTDSLVVVIALLVALALGGLVLAATVGGSLYTIGLALFIVATALIFGELKRYFDRRDAHR